MLESLSKYLKKVTAKPTRKDFLKKAEEIRNIPDEKEREFQADKHARKFNEKNPNFDFYKFYKKVGVGHSWFGELSLEKKKAYIKKHPNSKYSKHYKDAKKKAAGK